MHVGPAEGEPEPAGGEAAKYRRRLRESEGQLAATRDQLAGYQRREVERLASARLAVPGDVFSVGGAALPDFLDDDGMVNAEAVEQSVAALLASRPGLAIGSTRWPDMGGGDRGPAMAQPRPASWGAVVRGEARR